MSRVHLPSRVLVQEHFPHIHALLSRSLSHTASHTFPKSRRKGSNATPTYALACVMDGGLHCVTSSHSRTSAPPQYMVGLLFHIFFSRKHAKNGQHGRTFPSAFAMEGSAPFLSSVSTTSSQRVVSAHAPNANGVLPFESLALT